MRACAPQWATCPISASRPCRHSASGQAGAQGVYAAVPRDLRHRRSDRVADPRAHGARPDGGPAWSRAAQRRGPRARPGQRRRHHHVVARLLRCVGERRCGRQGAAVAVEHVDGGLDDHKVLYVDPSGGGTVPGEVVDTIEYYNAALDHYFITAFAGRGGRPRRRRSVRAGRAPATRSAAGSRAPVPATKRAGSSARRASDRTRTSTRSTRPSATR